MSFLHLFLAFQSLHCFLVTTTRIVTGMSRGTGSTRSGTTSATGFCPNASSKRPTASATVTVIRALSSSCVNGCPTGNASCDASCVMALGSARCWDGCIDSPEGACALPLLSVLRKSSFGRLPALRIMDEEIRMVWGWRGGTGMEYRVIWDLGGNTQGFLPLNIEFLCDCRKVMVVQIWEYMKETSES
nr:hypothetical protein Iba_chr03aCG6080 [Ipomoea batatas]